MRKTFLVVSAVIGIGLLTTMSAIAVPAGGAGAMLDAAKACSAVENAHWICRRRCGWFRGQWICRRNCYWLRNY